MPAPRSSAKSVTKRAPSVSTFCSIKSFLSCRLESKPPASQWVSRGLRRIPNQARHNKQLLPRGPLMSKGYLFNRIGFEGFAIEVDIVDVSLHPQSGTWMIRRRQSMCKRMLRLVPCSHVNQSRRAEAVRLTLQKGNASAPPQPRKHTEHQGLKEQYQIRRTGRPGFCISAVLESVGSHSLRARQNLQ